MNKPYVKQYDKDGNVSNPITKDNPYTQEPGRGARRRRRKEPRFVSNRRGVRLVAGTVMGVDEKGRTMVSRFKYRKRVQRIGNKVILHEDMIV